MERLIEIKAIRDEYDKALNKWIRYQIGKIWYGSTSGKAVLLGNLDNDNVIWIEDNKITKNTTKLSKETLDGILSGVIAEVYLEVGDV